ncbi:MAG: alpha-amylase [Pelagibacterales bacterium]|nr:alpha-amylase [Pelagibacterales bacterium]|tara:strand:+ start:3028 stop:4758 length:1731 start_codon:yes stop_codon:yes gene_type:complete
MNNKVFHNIIFEHLNNIYSYILSPKEINDLTFEVIKLSTNRKVKKNKFLTQEDIILVTYADTIIENNKSSFFVLNKFLKKYIKNIFSTIHILPFFPSSSDGGFSVIDFFLVDKKHGSWNDIKKMSADYKIMVDVVLNHGSKKSKWFKNFLNNKGEGKNFYLNFDKNINVSNVVRARSHKLLQKVSTENGFKYVWCTFSTDQVDFDYRNPKVLLMFLKIIKFILAKGPIVFRMDAVAFLWKRIGSSCVNLDQTHAIIRLIRAFLSKLNSNSLIVTETNLPFHENLSYFGNSDEAHLIYNFSLAPLIINTLIKGDSTAFRRWSMSMPPSRIGASYVNFISNHDGLGIRPLEGILNKKDLNLFLDTLKKFGSKFTFRKYKNTSVVYEANISLVNALSGTIKGKDKYAFKRYICAHSIMLSYEGIPAIYIHSLFGTKNDNLLYKKTNIKRSINRHIYSYMNLEKELKSNNSDLNKVFNNLLELIKIRKKQKAFHPNATQYTLNLGKRFFGLWRQSNDKQQSIFAISNISNMITYLDLTSLNLINTENWFDILSKGNTKIESKNNKLKFLPYQTIWITNYK